MFALVIDRAYSMESKGKAWKKHDSGYHAIQGMS